MLLAPRPGPGRQPVGAARADRPRHPGGQAVPGKLLRRHRRHLYGLLDAVQDQWQNLEAAREKGNRRRTIGFHFAAAEAIGEYIKKPELASGHLFRPRSSPNSRSLPERAFSPTAMYLLLEKYLKRLPGAMNLAKGLAVESISPNGYHR